MPESVILNAKNTKTPASQGYHMPAEWAKQEAVWLSWPHNDITWPGKKMALVWDTYLQMLEALLPYQKVKLLLAPSLRDKVVRFLAPKLSPKAMGNLILIGQPTVDAWIRDYGPTFVVKKNQKAWVKWIFNAWGSKYMDLAEDTRIFENKKMISQPCFDAGIVMEGGSIEVNGAGVVMTSEQCLLNKNRNPELTQIEIERYLQEYLGVSQVLWLNQGVEGDDTDGHIDDIARFTDEKTIVAVYEDNELDDNYALLRENWERLQAAETPQGKRWNLVKLPMPEPVEDSAGRLPASYANFLISNGAVLLPVFECKQDKTAVKIIQELFPKKEVVPISCRTLVGGLGTIHCVSQQEPLIP